MAAWQSLLHHMSISVPKGFSVSLPVNITDGPVPNPDTSTPLTNVKSDDPWIRVVYPDPTPGVTNPARSIRVDALGNPGQGTNVHATFVSPLDGAIRNMSDTATITAPPNNGTASFGTPSAPFLTPP
jgi:hypothetical protein